MILQPRLFLIDFKKRRAQLFCFSTIIRRDFPENVGELKYNPYERIDLKIKYNAIMFFLSKSNQAT